MAKQLKSAVMSNVFGTVIVQNGVASFRYKFNLNFFLFQAIITIDLGSSLVQTVDFTILSAT